ncbi:hypothetical protein E2C01_087690 [Portunus trituberculatus]|uniref:Uncharacterized protein n=1 Tax=Portunus trituberculatus TaxID=210409 RepID=A0A5B7JK17_PORTR|nr:hypothetical protein [Portunus trituberculatus]
MYTCTACPSAPLASVSPLATLRGALKAICPMIVTPRPLTSAASASAVCGDSWKCCVKERTARKGSK